MAGVAVAMAQVPARGLRQLLGRYGLQASLALMAYASGLLAFSMVKVLAPGYFARQDTRTPMRIGIQALGLNMGLNLAIVLPLALINDRPGLHALLALNKGGAEPAIDQRHRLDPEKLFQPKQIAHMQGFVDAQGLKDLSAHFGRHGQWDLRCGRAGGKIDQKEDDKTDQQKRRDGQK